MKFDKVLMNPPYSKNLHLKILSDAMKHSDEVVNLSPIRWLEDPLAEYKEKSDWKTFENIRERISSLETVPAAEAEKYFDAAFPFNLGVYYITKNGGWVNPFKNELLDKMLKKVIAGDTVDKHIVYDDMKGISLLISLVSSSCGSRKSISDSFSMKREKCFFTGGKNDFTGETYLEQRTKSAWGIVKPKAENTNIKFGSKEERENFYNSWNTKCLKWLFNKERVDICIQSRYLPYLGDYTHPRTDEMLYNYFDLTQKERETIENEIQ